MLTVYLLVEGQLEVIKNFMSPNIPKEAVWIDMMNPTHEEEVLVERTLGINVFTYQEMKMVEVMSRSFQEGEASYMTATVVKSYEKDTAETDAISFILTKDHLVTLRYFDPKSFNIFADYAKQHPYICMSSASVMQGIFSSIVNRLADILDRAGEKLNDISGNIFNHREKTDKSEYSSANLTELLKEIGRSGDLTSKMRESLLSLDRVLIFLDQIDEGDLSQDFLVKLRNMRKDIHSLNEQSMFLSQEVNFLLSATLGMINIEQNDIIKIFSIAAVIFLPPTLIASLFGMNFKFMPELSWHFGYFYAIALMLLSAVLPLAFFRRKGWL